MNSGDWVENLTSLEYSNGKWSIYRHPYGLIEEVTSSVKTDTVSEIVNGKSSQKNSSQTTSEAV